MAQELTQRQRRVIEAIQAWITEHGFPPTIRELGKQVGIKSLRGVTTHLDALAKKGHLTRQRSARGIRLLQESGSYTTAHYVPIVGRIAAGAPLLAQEHLEGQLLIDASLLGQREPEHPSQHFALRVRGESMQGAGILDGDYVIVRQQSDAEHGNIVAALLGDEATVKRLFKDGDRIRLQPEHPTMAPIVVEPGQPIEILGKVVAAFRQLV